MKIRVTTTTPGYRSLITPEHQKIARNQLVDFPWCFKGNVEGDWRTFDPKQWGIAAAKGTTGEIVMDCENAYADLAGGESNICTASYIFDRAGTLAFLHKWSGILKACKEACKTVRKSTSIYSYPTYPGPIGVDIWDKEKWPDKRDRVTEDLAFIATEKRIIGSDLFAPMIEAYVYETMTDFYQNLDAELARCASIGLTPKIVLVTAFYIKTQMQGPAISFIGPKLVLEIAKAIRDQGLEICFFNPDYPPAMDAIAHAAAEL